MNVGGSFAGRPNVCFVEFQFFGGVMKPYVRRMFGGEGIYAGEQIIGLVVDERLYLKTTDSNRADFLAEGAHRFFYVRPMDQAFADLV